MTLDQSHACPSCGRDDSIDLDGGGHLCLACRHEWNPADVPASSLAALDLDPHDFSRAAMLLELSRAQSPLQVFGAFRHDALDTADVTAVAEYVAPQGDWAGMFVERKRGGRVLLVITDDGGDTIECENERSKRVTVRRDDVRLLGPELGTPDATADTPVTTDDEPFQPTIFAVAALALTVGAQAVADDEDRSLLSPRIGWLPPPANEVPEIEQGVAYAVATLISRFNLDRAQVLAIAGSFMTSAQAGTEQENNE